MIASAVRANRIDPFEKGSAQKRAARDTQHAARPTVQRKAVAMASSRSSICRKSLPTASSTPPPRSETKARNALGPAAILRGLGHVDRGPARLQARICRHLPCKMRAGPILDQIIQRAGTASARPHHVEQMRRTSGLELLPQERYLGFDPGPHLLLQGRSGFQEDGDAEHERRAGENGDIERGQSEAGRPRQPGRANQLTTGRGREPVEHSRRREPYGSARRRHAARASSAAG